MAKQTQPVTNFSQPKQSIEVIDSRRLTILIVEDRDENLRLLRGILEESGFETLGVPGGREALETLTGRSVDLIVADAMMPGLDGFQLCKEVRANPLLRSIPFIIYTGNYVDARDEEFARNIGVDRYVVKSGGVDPLVNAVRELAEVRCRVSRADRATDGLRLDDRTFLEQHHAVIVRKLEEKMAELELHAHSLEIRNREIQASEDRYRSLFNDASIAICVVDRRTGKVEDANRRALELLGYSREGLLSLPMLPFADRGIAPRSGWDSSGFFTGEAKIVTREGEVRHVDVGAGSIAEPDGNKVLLYLRDITERLRLREQLMQADKLSVMGRIAAGIAHEIRNPISAVTINLQYLLQKHGSEPSVRQAALDALEGAGRVMTVVENTLALARVSPAATTLEAVNALVDTVMSFLELSVRQNNVRLRQDLGEDLPSIRVDARQIQQALLNVVQNAIEASRKGGVVTIETSAIARSPDGRGPWVVIAVRDEGEGISEESQKRLFEQFYTTKPGGTGLGLSLSKQILERHGGDILVESNPGKGTMVSLLLPAERAEGGMRQ